MRKLITAAFISLPLMASGPGGGPGDGHGGNGNSAVATAQSFAKIMAPVKLVATQDLNFGSIVLDELGKKASVELTFNSSGGGSPVLTHQELENCAFYTKTDPPTAAFFHYQRDSFNGGGPRSGAPDGDPNVSIDIAATDLTGPAGKKCHLTTKNDLPVDSCLYFPAKEGTTAKHFSVFGKLDIPEDAVPGCYKGTIFVKVAYN